MKTENINQVVTFNTSPDEVYALIMDAEKHAAFSGAKAHTSQKINGKFDAYDGYCHGYNMELERGKKIVQAWHFAEEGWPDTHFSVCTFELKKKGKGTTLTFTQTGIPAHKVEALKSGWKEFYWEPMKEYLSNS